ncbi:hypothetical protein GCM10010149_91640 [Nonomuraea roseoviolacea subsp. roseoviolacea]
MTADSTTAPPPGVDPTMPTITWIYEYLLDNEVAVDRELPDRVLKVTPNARKKAAISAAQPSDLSNATEVLSDETAQLLAAQLQASWGGRWQVMWEPWGRKFRAFPAYDMDVSTPVEGANLRELWRAVLDVDQALLFAVAEAVPAQPPRVVHIPLGFLQEVLG